MDALIKRMIIRFTITQPPYKNRCSPENFSSNHPCNYSKWLVLLTSPNQWQPMPSPLNLSFFYARDTVLTYCTTVYIYCPLNLGVYFVVIVQVSLLVFKTLLEAPSYWKTRIFIKILRIFTSWPWCFHPINVFHSRLVNFLTLIHTT